MDYENGIEEIRRELEPYLEQYVSRICGDIGKVGEAAGSALDYLEHQVPDYPFDRRLDGALITELMTSFPNLDVLEEMKTFRWSHREPVTRMANPRATLREWILSGAAGLRGS
jgi:hypothetical protein